jgi:hypothetical protein
MIGFLKVSNFGYLTNIQYNKQIKHTTQKEVLRCIAKKQARTSDEDRNNEQDRYSLIV